MFFKNNIFKNLIKNYGVRSFFWRCFAMLLIGLLPFSLGFGFVVVKSNNQALNQSLIIQSNNAIKDAERTIDDIFVSIDRIQSEFILDINLELFLSSEFSYEREYSKYISEITSTMDNYILSLGTIDSIYIYNLNTDFVISSSGKENTFASDFSDMAWYTQYKTGKENIFIRNINTNSKQRERLYVTCCKSLFYNNKEEAIIVYNIKYESFEEIFDKEGISFYVFYEDGECFYPYNRGDELNYIYNSEIKQKKEMFMDTTVSVYNDTTGFYIVSQNEKAMAQGNGEYVITLICLSLLMIIVSFLVALFSTIRIYSAIVRIIMAVQYPEQYKNGSDEKKQLKKEFKVLKNFKNKYDKNLKQDEISYIISRFLGTNDKNSVMEAELAFNVHKLKEAQSVALQAQFTPHFLFNTLQIINLLEMQKNMGETEVMKITTLLSQLLRYTLNSVDYFVSLETELEYLQKYIKIQSYKYNGNVDVHWDIEEDMLDMKCVKFILQPIVENSFYYGISANEDGGNIYISAKSENENLVIKVQNDGTKISEKKCREINYEIEKIDIRRKTSFGLLNVNHRIKLLYGDKYGCKIGIEDNMTTVTVKLPQIKENQN